MELQRALHAAILGGLIVALAPAQAKNRNETLYEVVKGMPWDVAKSGPLVAICPAMIVHGSTLDELGFKRVAMGGLTAIVPTKMVTINSHFTDAPNLYDGLPQSAKVLYLLTILSPGQLNKITGDGLSLSDCQGESLAVMQSILTPKIKYKIGTQIEFNSITYDTDGGREHELTDAQRAQMKLRVCRHIELILPLKNDGGFTGSSLPDKFVKGTKCAYIAEDNGEEFGQRIRIESDNTLRKSQLDYTSPSLDKPISLQPVEKMPDLVGRIASATGLELYVDPHFTNMIVFGAGKQVIARDLLQAIALGVCGTYRQLGSVFVLTNDLEGMAVHQARIAAWEDDLDKLVRDREDQFRAAITRAGSFPKIKFNPGNYDHFTSSELSSLEVNSKDSSDNRYINITDASPAVQQTVRDFNYGNNLDRNKVGISSSVRFELILPDGSKDWLPRWLGNANQFRSDPHPWEPAKFEPVSMPLNPTPKLLGLLLHADSPGTVRAEITLVKNLGLTNLWLETFSQDTLDAAIDSAAKNGVKVSLALRPLAALPGEKLSDPDRTTSSDHGLSLARRKEAFQTWINLWIENSAFQPLTRDQLSPLDPSMPSRLAQLAKLANTPGLSNVVILGGFPIGYAKDTSYSYGSYFYTPQVDNFFTYGYSYAQRLTFLRNERVDPVDIENQSITTKISLQEAWGNAWGGGGSYNKWQKTRGQWAHDAMLSLLTSIQGTEASPRILVEPQPKSTHVPPNGSVFLFPWKKGDDVPSAIQDFSGWELAKLCDCKVIEIQDDHNPDYRARVAAAIKKQLDSSEKPFILDLSSVPVGRLEPILKRWLRKSSSE